MHGSYCEHSFDLLTSAFLSASLKLAVARLGSLHFTRCQFTSHKALRDDEVKSLH